MRKISFLDGVKVHSDYAKAVENHPVIRAMREATLPGRIANPKPMNPASKIWPDHNPNVIYITSGAWQRCDVTGDAEKWRKWIQEQRT